MTLKIHGCRGGSRLKFLSQELAGDQEASRRLQREAETIRAAQSPPTSALSTRSRSTKGAAFIAMERVDGTNLKLHMTRKTLTDSEIIDIARQVAAALQAAHESRRGSPRHQAGQKHHDWTGPVL